MNKEIIYTAIAGTILILMLVITIVAGIIYLSKLRRKISRIESQKVIMDKVINFLDECPTLNPLHANKVLEMVIEYKDLQRGLPKFECPPMPPEAINMGSFVVKEYPEGSEQGVRAAPPPKPPERPKLLWRHKGPGNPIGYRGWVLTDLNESVTADERSDIDKFESMREEMEEFCKEKSGIGDPRAFEYIVALNAYAPPLELEEFFAMRYSRTDGIVGFCIGAKHFKKFESWAVQ